MPPETTSTTKESVSAEVLISPERKKQIRDDLTYFQLFAFQGPRITTGDGKLPLGQLDEKNVAYEYAGFREDEWGHLAVAMTSHGNIGGQRSYENIILRFYPLINPVAPRELSEKKD